MGGGGRRARASLRAGAPPTPPSLRDALRARAWRRFKVPKAVELVDEPLPRTAVRQAPAPRPSLGSAHVIDPDGSRASRPASGWERRRAALGARARDRLPGGRAARRALDGRPPRARSPARRSSSSPPAAGDVGLPRAPSCCVPVASSILHRRRRGHGRGRPARTARRLACPTASRSTTSRWSSSGSTRRLATIDGDPLPLRLPCTRVDPGGGAARGAPRPEARRRASSLAVWARAPTTTRGSSAMPDAARRSSASRRPTDPARPGAVRAVRCPACSPTSLRGRRASTRAEIEPIELTFRAPVARRLVGHDARDVRSDHAPGAWTAFHRPTHYALRDAVDDALGAVRRSPTAASPCPGARVGRRRRRPGPAQLQRPAEERGDAAAASSSTPRAQRLGHDARRTARRPRAAARPRASARRSRPASTLVDAERHGGADPALGLGTVRARPDERPSPVVSASLVARRGDQRTGPTAGKQPHLASRGRRSAEAIAADVRPRSRQPLFAPATDTTAHPLAEPLQRPPRLAATSRTTSASTPRASAARARPARAARIASIGRRVVDDRARRPAAPRSAPSAPRLRRRRACPGTRRASASIRTSARSASARPSSTRRSAATASASSARVSTRPTAQRDADRVDHRLDLPGLRARTRAPSPASGSGAGPPSPPSRQAQLVGRQQVQRPAHAPTP